MAKEEFIPVDMVKKLAKEGKTEPEIIASLRSHGFTPRQIDSAMRTALKNAVERLPPPAAAPPLRPPEIRSPPPHGHAPMGIPPEHIQVPRELMPMEIPSEAMPAPLKLSTPPHGLAGKHVHGKVPEHAAPAHPPARIPGTAGQGHDGSEIGLEELIEAVVAERMKEVQSAVSKAESAHSSMTRQIDEMHLLDRKLEDMEKRVQVDLRQHMEESRSLEDRLGSRVAALETSFKELASWLKKK